MNNHHENNPHHSILSAPWLYGDVDVNDGRGRKDRPKITNDFITDIKIMSEQGDSKVFIDWMQEA